MTDFSQLADLVGILDAVLIVAIVFVWREWRKAEAKIVEVMEKHNDANLKTIKDYSELRHVLERLVSVVTGN